MNNETNVNEKHYELLVNELSNISNIITISKKDENVVQYMCNNFGIFYAKDKTFSIHKNQIFPQFIKVVSAGKSEEEVIRNISKQINQLLISLLIMTAYENNNIKYFDKSFNISDKNILETVIHIVERNRLLVDNIVTVMPHDNKYLYQWYYNGFEDFKNITMFDNIIITTTNKDINGINMVVLDTEMKNDTANGIMGSIQLSMSISNPNAVGGVIESQYVDKILLNIEDIKKKSIN